MLKSYTSQSTDKTLTRVNTQISQSDNKQNYQHINQNINQNIASIQDTINMLKEYEKLCIEKEQFLIAEETKQKIQFLLAQSKTIKKEREVLKQQENVENICKEGEEEVQKFQQFWNQTIQNLVEQLKQIQVNAIKQHQHQLQNYKIKVLQQDPPKIKYSAKVLELRKNLSSLIKVRKYRQADQIKNKLKQLEAQCEQQWQVKNIQRQNAFIQKFEKKQVSQINALRKKLQGIFHQKIKQRDQKFQILLKRNRKRRIQSSKTKINRPGQTIFLRQKSQSRVLRDSKISSFNNSVKA